MSFKRFHCDEVGTGISDNEARYEQMGRCITVLKDQTGIITEFDNALWSSLVEKIVVNSKEQGRCEGAIQGRHRDESRIRCGADTALRIDVMGVFSMRIDCKQYGFAIERNQSMCYNKLHL